MFITHRGYYKQDGVRINSDSNPLLSNLLLQNQKSWNMDRNDSVQSINQSIDRSIEWPEMQPKMKGNSRERTQSMKIKENSIKDQNDSFRNETCGNLSCNLRKRPAAWSLSSTLPTSSWMPAMTCRHCSMSATEEQREKDSSACSKHLSRSRLLVLSSSFPRRNQALPWKPKEMSQMFFW